MFHSKLCSLQNALYKVPPQPPLKMLLRSQDLEPYSRTSGMTAIYSLEKDEIITKGELQCAG